MLDAGVVGVGPEKNVTMAQDVIAAGLAKERLDELVRVSRMMGEQ